jgi:four helix bundle protein
MGSTEWLEYKTQLRDRLKIFALNILKLSELHPKSARGRTVNNQLTRSGTSVYANFRAALRSRSKNEFYSKLCIVVEEVDEAEMWLDLTIDSELLSGSLVCDLHDESLELTKILAQMRRKIGRSEGKKKKGWD